MSSADYKAAYERQKMARERAEQNLEDRSRELFEANQSLTEAYNRLKDQKAHIIHQEKLAAIGQLSAGVAHEINNPTGFVKSNLHSLKRYSLNLKQVFSAFDNFFSELGLTDEKLTGIQEIKSKFDIDYILEDIDDVLTESIDGLSRIEEIVKGLKNFSRPDNEGDEEYSLNECVENTLKIVSNQIKYNSEVEVNLSAIPMVLGKPGAMSQVLLNLIVNASDAMAESGLIVVSTSVSGDEVLVTVEDNGCGIPENVLSRIFDPFFTTKAIGKGTGLGLSISHGIVKKQGGRIVIDTTEGAGTKFSIFLPVPH